MSLTGAHFLSAPAPDTERLLAEALKLNADLLAQHDRDVAHAAELKAVIRGLRQSLADVLEHNDVLQDMLDIYEKMPDLLKAWSATYPDLGDAHDTHSRGHFMVSDCSGCRAEFALLELAQSLADEPVLVGQSDCSRGASAPVPATS